MINGKIVEGWDNWDQLGLLVQIGAVTLRRISCRWPKRGEARVPDRHSLKTHVRTIGSLRLHRTSFGKYRLRSG